MYTSTYLYQICAFLVCGHLCMCVGGCACMCVGGWEIRREACVKCLTPSLIQPVKFLGWRMHRHACKQYIFQSHNICFQWYALWWWALHMPMQKRRERGLWVSNFALSWVVCKWHHGSEGVNVFITRASLLLFYEFRCKLALKCGEAQVRYSALFPRYCLSTLFIYVLDLPYIGLTFCL